MSSKETLTKAETKLPTPEDTNTEESRQNRFKEMFTEFTQKAADETGYTLVPQIGPNGPFNTITKVPQQQSSSSTEDTQIKE